MSLPTSATGPVTIVLPPGVTGANLPEEVKVCSTPEDGEFNASNVPPGLGPFSPDCGPLPFPTLNQTGPRPPLTEIAGTGNPWFYSQSQLKNTPHKWAFYESRVYPEASHADAIGEGANALSLDGGNSISIGKNAISSADHGLIGYISIGPYFRSNIREPGPTLTSPGPVAIDSFIESLIDDKDYETIIPYGAAGDYDSDGGSISIGANSHALHIDFSGVGFNEDAGAAISMGKDSKSTNAITIGSRAKSFRGVTIGHRSGSARGSTDVGGGVAAPSQGSANVIIGHDIYAEDNPEDGSFAAPASHAGGAFNILIGSTMLTYATKAARSNVLIGSTTLTTYYSPGPEQPAWQVPATPITGNVGVGMRSLHNIKNANYNTSVGYNSGYNNFGGHNNTCLGANTLPAPSLLGRPTYSPYTVGDVTNVTCLGYGTDVSNNNQVQLGNSATTTYCYGSVQDRSDLRDKSDIRTTALGLNFILKLRPVDFKWDYREDYKEIVTEVTVVDGEEKHNITVKEFPKDGSKKRNRYHHGLIAQDVKEVMNELGVDFGGYQDHSVTGGADILSIGYQELIAPLIKAVQELSEKVNSLENELKMMKDNDNK